MIESNLVSYVAGEVADAAMFAVTRPVGVDCVTLRIEPMDQKIT